MIVRQDDTMVCDECYVLECAESPTGEPVPSRQIFATVSGGECDMCGCVEDD